MGVAQEAWLEDDENLTKWEDGTLSVGDRRVLLTHWFSICVKGSPPKYAGVVALS